MLDKIKCMKIYILLLRGWKNYTMGNMVELLFYILVVNII
jgi:hypothetical protein